LVSTGACLAVLSACDGGGEAADLAFEVAVEVDSTECGMTAVGRNPALGNRPCATVRLFEQSPSGALTPIRLFNPSGEDRDGEGELERRVQLDETRRIQFDARIPEPGTAHTLVFRFYDGMGNPVFGATVADREFGPDQPRLRVRLYPFREFACAGTGLDASLARALHQAVRLDNGDVVIFGGVTGTDLNPTSIRDPANLPGATLARSVVLYDSSEHEFVRLGGEEFGRVGFAAQYVGVGADGRHRIRVVGGYAPQAPSSPLVLLNNVARFSTYMEPFSFTSEPVLQDPVELVVDVAGASLEIERLEVTPVAVGGFASISESTPGVASLVVPGLLSPLDGMEPNRPRRLDNSYFFLVEGEEPANTPRAASSVGRIGATANWLPSQDAWLVWGGGVGDDDGMEGTLAPDIGDVAGELIAMDGVRQVLAAGSGIPEPIAFHTATRFPTTSDGTSDTVVFVGGYELRVNRTVGVRPTLAPIVALRFTGTTVLPRVIAQCEFVTGPTPDSLVSECDYENTAFHTATVVPGVGLVIIGGARTHDELSPAAARRFVATNAVSVVDSALRLERLPEVSALTLPRFGHTATLLPGNRLLVVGGFRDGADDVLSAVAEPEMIYLDKAPPRVAGTQCVDTSDLPDGGADAGVDAGEFTFDAGPDGGPDAGPDAGLPDGALPDGSLPDGSVPDGAVMDGSTVDAGG
ncbi:MAG: hypothetical protein AB8I08_21920, partial [Sandaracinaceae bacterium]